MPIEKIANFNDFTKTIKDIGFCTASNDDRIFNLTKYYDVNIFNHTGDKETDPWEWRMRSVKETDFMVYGKVFFKKAGWITMDWLAYFILLRRKNKSFDEMYHDGLISFMEKQIYNCIISNHEISLHDLKINIGCEKSDNSKFTTALTNLQMKLLITICGESYKTSFEGNAFGWPVTTFCSLDEKVEPYIRYQTDYEKTYNALVTNIKQFNPAANEKDIKKFILG